MNSDGLRPPAHDNSAGGGRPPGGRGQPGRSSAGVSAERLQGFDLPGVSTGAPTEHYFSRPGLPAAAGAAASTGIILPGLRDATIEWGSGAGGPSGEQSFAARLSSSQTGGQNVNGVNEADVLDWMERSQPNQSTLRIVDPFDQNTNAGPLAQNR